MDSAPSTPEPADDSPLSGKQLGEYQLLRRLGRGGMSDVYLAEQKSLRRKVAFKVLKSDLAEDEAFVRRFHKEAQAAAALVHANIVQIHEVGCIDGVHYIAQEYVAGQSLAQYLVRHGAVDIELAISIIFQVAAALGRAGDQGIIHRDIKPSNVLVDDHQSVHVLDFGLVRLLERGDTLTRAGRLVGTVAFMSPEQTTGIALTAGSDIFSAGLVLYEGLVGPRERPHKQEEWLGRMCLQRVVPLCIREPAIPRGLSNLVDQMLALDPHDRPTASECAQAFRELQHGRGTPDWPDPPQFVGRTNELDELIHAFDPGAAPLHVLQGPTGSGRSRGGGDIYLPVPFTSLLHQHADQFECFLTITNRLIRVSTQQVCQPHCRQHIVGFDL